MNFKDHVYVGETTSYVSSCTGDGSNREASAMRSNFPEFGRYRRMRRSVGAAAALCAMAGVGAAYDVPASAATHRNAAETAATSASARLGNPNCVDATPSSVTGGGSSPAVYTYTVGHLTISRTIPASGFDPTTASDSALVANGYPARPADSGNLSRWKSEVSATVVGPGLCVDQTRRNGTTGGHDVPAGGNPVWAGVVNTTGINAFKEVDGEFHQTGFRSTACANSHSSSWVGLGGYHNGYLVQAGTDDNPDGSSADFFEAIINNTYPAPVSAGLRINGGDHVYTEVQDVNANSVQFEVWDITNGQDTGLVTASATGIYNAGYNGATAEYIDERPSNGSLQPYPLREWYNHNILWDSAYYQLTSGGAGSQASGSTFHHLLLMENSASQALAGIYPDMTNNTTWTDNYTKCQ